jgi:hypothetical protein
MKKYYSIVCILIVLGLTNCRSIMGNKSDMNGWHFHICSSETTAPTIWFEVSGTTNNSTYKSARFKWTGRKSDFIGVTSDLRNLEEISVTIKTARRKRAKICILYNDHVVKTVDVTGRENTQVNKTNSDDCPC